MRIGDVARKAGTTASRIRFYEKEGLLPPAARHANGYRDYAPATLEVLAFIERAQSFGFSLKEIAPAIDAGTVVTLSPDVTVPALTRKLAELDEHIAQSIDLRRRLRKLLKEQEACAPPKGRGRVRQSRPPKAD